MQLHALADELDTGLDTIAVHYRSKDDLVDAWYDRADRALLQRGTDPALLDLSPAQRLEVLLLAWLSRLTNRSRSLKGVKSTP